MKKNSFFFCINFFPFKQVLISCPYGKEVFITNHIFDSLIAKIMEVKWNKFLYPIYCNVLTIFFMLKYLTFFSALEKTKKHHFFLFKNTVCFYLWSQLCDFSIIWNNRLKNDEKERENINNLILFSKNSILYVTRKLYLTNKRHWTKSAYLFPICQTKNRFRSYHKNDFKIKLKWSNHNHSCPVLSEQRSSFRLSCQTWFSLVNTVKARCSFKPKRLSFFSNCNLCITHFHHFF